MNTGVMWTLSQPYSFGGRLARLMVWTHGLVLFLDHTLDQSSWLDCWIFIFIHISNPPESDSLQSIVQDFFQDLLGPFWSWIMGPRFHVAPLDWISPQDRQDWNTRSPPLLASIHVSWTIRKAGNFHTLADDSVETSGLDVHDHRSGASSAHAPPEHELPVLRMLFQGPSPSCAPHDAGGRIYCSSHGRVSSCCGGCSPGTATSSCSPPCDIGCWMSRSAPLAASDSSSLPPFSVLTTTS